MIIRFKIWKWRISITCAETTSVMGVNSTVGEDEHILMWDFDNVSLPKVMAVLYNIQERERLPPIRIFKTSRGAHYQAYCYKRCSWYDSKRIVANTRRHDEGFFRFGVFRGHWTLRTSAKNGEKIKLVRILPSDVKEDCSEFDLMSWTRYETLA